MLGLSNTVMVVNKKRGGGFSPAPQPKKDKTMLEKLYELTIGNMVYLVKNWNDLQWFSDSSE